MSSGIAEDVKAIRERLDKTYRQCWIVILIAVVALFLSIIYKEAPFKDNFRRDAQELYEQGKYDEVRSLAEERKLVRPNDPEIYWFLAKVERMDGNRELAIEHLNYLRALEPSWAHDYVDVLLEAIESDTLKKGGQSEAP